jgi:DNA-binding NtrC family response regulator
MEEELKATQGMLYTDGTSGELKVRRFIVRVVDGPDKGKERTLDAGTVLAGSHENNDLVLSDSTISRYHLELQLRAEGVRVTDQDSTNGTYLNDTRLGSVVVNKRTLVRLGGQTELEIIPADELVQLDDFEQNRFGEAYGATRAMAEVFAVLNRASQGDSSVLFVGESGTGKELLAKSLHQASPRKDNPFVVVSLASLDKDNLVAELFGDEKDPDRVGLLEQAAGGTVFFDEISDLSLNLQPQVLRILEQGEYRRAGSSQARPIDVRVLAGTKTRLADLVRKGTFREDLYFRLGVVRLALPPLRDRMDDIPGLVRVFLEKLGQDDFYISETMTKQLLSHNWPGNIRELRVVVERGMAIATARLSGDLEFPGQPIEEREAGAGVSDEMMDMPFKEAKGMLVESFEREYLDRLLKRHNGNVSRAAAEAGIDRNYIHRLVKKYEITVERN